MIRSERLLNLAYTLKTEFRNADPNATSLSWEPPLSKVMEMMYAFAARFSTDGFSFEPKVPDKISSHLDDALKYHYGNGENVPVVVTSASEKGRNPSPWIGYRTELFPGSEARNFFRSFSACAFSWGRGEQIAREARYFRSVVEMTFGDSHMVKAELERTYDWATPLIEAVSEQMLAILSGYVLTSWSKLAKRPLTGDSPSLHIMLEALARMLPHAVIMYWPGERNNVPTSLFAIGG